LMVVFAATLPARAGHASTRVGPPKVSPTVVSEPTDGLKPASTRAEAPAGFIKEFAFQSQKCGPSIVKVDSEDNVWIAMARAEKIARFHDGDLREYSLPPKSFRVGIAVASARQVWYSDIRRNKIGRLDPSNGAVKDYDIPTKDSWPFYIVLDLEGK